MEEKKLKKFDIHDYNDIVKDWSEYEPLTAKEAIIAKCHECCCYQSEEVILSPCNSCPLYQFKIKWYKRWKNISVSEEERKKRSEALKNRMKNKK